MKPWSKSLALGLVAMVAATTAACSKENSGASDAAATKSPSSHDVQSALDEGYKGTFRSLPASSPKPVGGKAVWVIASTLQSPSATSVANGVKDAGDLLGWKTTVFDGKGSPTQYNDGIRQAMAAKADAVVLDIVECAPVNAALKEAKAAGMKVIGTVGQDCEASGAGPDLFDADTWDTYHGGREASVQDNARFGAAWVASKAPDDAGVMQMVEPDYPSLTPRTDAFRTELKKFCPGCHVDQVQFALTDLGTNLRQKVESGLLQYPDDDFVTFPYDTAVLLGGAAAIQGSPRHAQLQVLGGECQAPNVELIRAGSGQNACVGTPYPWIGWVAADSLNRVFNNSPQVDEGLGLQLIDADHNLPAKGVTFDGTEDYQANFKKIWGVS